MPAAIQRLNVGSADANVTFNPRTNSYTVEANGNTVVVNTRNGDTLQLTGAGGGRITFNGPMPINRPALVINSATDDPSTLVPPASGNITLTGGTMLVAAAPASLTTITQTGNGQARHYNVGEPNSQLTKPRDSNGAAGTNRTLTLQNPTATGVTATGAQITVGGNASIVVFNPNNTHRNGSAQITVGTERRDALLTVNANETFTQSQARVTDAVTTSIQTVSTSLAGQTVSPAAQAAQTAINNNMRQVAPATAQSAAIRQIMTIANADSNSVPFNQRLLQSNAQRYWNALPRETRNALSNARTDAEFTAAFIQNSANLPGDRVLGIGAAANFSTMPAYRDAAASIVENTAILNRETAASSAAAPTAADRNATLRNAGMPTTVTPLPAAPTRGTTGNDIDPNRRAIDPAVIPDGLRVSLDTAQQLAGRVLAMSGISLADSTPERTSMDVQVSNQRRGTMPITNGPTLTV